MTVSSEDRPFEDGVLVVCTANICRSPAAAHLLGVAAGPDLPILSAGTHAFRGAAGCSRASRRIKAMGYPAPAEHFAQPLREPLVRAATLVLTASREHRAAVVALVPAAQRRTFTLPQAARLSRWLAEQGTPPPDVAGPDRLAWLVDELDAARGSAGRPLPPDLDDLPDPHLDLLDSLGLNDVDPHDVVLQRIAADVAALAHWLAPQNGGGASSSELALDPPPATGSRVGGRA